MKPKGFTCKQCGDPIGRPHLWCSKCKAKAIEEAKRREQP